MQLTKLFSLIQETLYQQGFKLTPVLKNSMTCAHYVLSDRDLVRKKINREFNYEAFFGHWLAVEQVYRQNGAKFNTSYSLTIVDCERSASHKIRRIKLKCDQTEQTLVKKITAFALEYKKYIEEKILAETIDDFLNNRE